MGKPSKEMFEHWRVKGRETPTLPYLMKYQEIAYSSSDDVNLRDVFIEQARAAEKALKLAIRELETVPIFKWARKQSGYRRAVDAVMPNLRKKFLDSEDWAAGAIRVFDAAFAIHPKRARTSYLLQSAFSRSLGESWSGQVFRALDEYYFSRKADELYLVAQKGPRSYKKMLECAKELLELTAGQHELKYDQGVRRLGKLLTDPAPNFDRLPITKNSLHKAEQLFVYRVWSLNVQATGKPKADAIVELMSLDGFEHEFDRRTVERMCARFKAAKIHLEGP